MPGDRGPIKVPMIPLADIVAFEVMELGPGHVVRIAPQCVRSVHNDGPEDAEILLISRRIDDLRADVDTVPDFWPE